MENKAPTFGEIPETLLRIKNFAKNKKSKKMLIYIFCNIFIIFFIIVFLSYFSFTKLIFHKKRRRKVFHKKSERNLIKNDKLFDGRIFLCTVYNNEAEYAYIQLWRLYDYIYRFIIVVSNKTFSGHPKNITFKPFEENINSYKDKIDIAYYDNVCNKNEYPFHNSIWCRENSQRDYALKYLEEHYNPTEKDLLIIADIDEIITKEGIQYIIKNPPTDYYFLKGYFYFPYYYHRLDDFDKILVIRYNKNIRTLSKKRLMTVTNRTTLKFKDNPTKPFVTHCSYCFKTIEAYRNKLKSYSHQEHNTKLKRSNNWIFKSHYCREKIGSPIIENDEPYEGWKHLIPDDPRLKYLVDRSFEYPLSQTSYTEKDLENMCNNTYNRTPFEPSAKYNYKL